MTAGLRQDLENGMLFQSVERVAAGLLRHRHPCVLTRNLVRQIAGADFFSRAVYGRSRDHVAQLAHVARPGIALEHLDRLRRKTAPRVVLLQEKSGEWTNIFEPLSNRRNLDLNGT